MLYHLNDPTGASLTLADETGAAAGRMVYDGYGSVLSNTLPLTLSGTLAGHPDAATGLVHQGGGRYYDPTLGRPLQPNPAGGPPAAPQALNRYAATPVGQPGVYQADVSSGISGVVQSAINQVPGLVAGEVATALTSNLASRTIYKTVPTGVARIALEGARRNLGWSYLDEFIVLESVSSRLANGFLRRPFSLLARSFRIRTMVGRAYIGETTEEIAQYQLRLQRSGITARILSREFDEVIDATATSASRSAAEALGGALGVGIGGVINAGVQYAHDYDNPYLTRSQKLRRVGISGFFGGVAGGAGLGAAAVFGGPVGIGVAFTVGIVLELEVVPRVFEFFGAIPTRDLYPLTSP